MTGVRTSSVKTPASFALVSEGERHRYPLKPGANRVGCLPASEICLDTRGVSKRHAILAVRRDRLSVEDLASKNGTFVNGERVERSEATPGDELRFGPVALRLERIPPVEGELAVELEPELPRPLSDYETSDVAPGVIPEGAWRSASVLRQTAAASLAFPEGYVRCTSPPMEELYRQLLAVAKSDLPILVLGETGVGKEGVARIVHGSSGRGEAPFVGINCAAIPAELLEAELFGIGKGVATGVAERAGKFEEAEGGTLLLDEIGEMPRGLQAKLLRTLQETEIHPVGRPSRPVDVRIVAATNSGLAERVANGDFRSDLYYRLAGFVVTVPPLSKRREDVPALVEHFLTRFSKEAGKAIRGITRGAMARLVERPWPGNVRELAHEVRRLVCLCPDHQVIDSTQIPDAASPVEAAGRAADPDPPEKTAESPRRGLDLESVSSLELAEIEKEAVAEALRRTEGNRTHAAKLLGISREALRRRITRLGVVET